QAFTAGSGRKGFSTAATLAGVWVSDLKTAPGQTVAEINHCATNVLSAERIHHNGNSMHRSGKVVGTLLVEDHGILHAGTTTLFDKDQESLATILGLLQQGLDSASRAGRQTHHRLTGAACFHTQNCSSPAARCQ